MKVYPDGQIANLRGKFKDDREATIKHLTDTGHSEKDAIDLADCIQEQIKGEEEAHKKELEIGFIADYKNKFGLLSDSARKIVFGELSNKENKEKVLEILNELIDLIPTLQHRENTNFKLIWLAIIGTLVEKDNFEKYVAALSYAIGSHILNLKKIINKPKVG